MEDLLYPFLEWYIDSPSWVKFCLGRFYRLLPMRVRHGKNFIYYQNLLKGSQKWSREKLEEYQTKKLKEILKHSYENVPYYRQVFDKSRIKPEDIKSLADLRKLPFMTKETIRDNLTELVASNYNSSQRIYMSTGGGTGIPVGFYLQKGLSRAKELAFMNSQWERVGYKSGDRSIWIRASVIRGAKKGKFWEYEPIKNLLIMSSYHLTDENLPQYVREVRRFKPAFIQAYPSAVTILARFMKKNKIEPFETVKALLCGSENIYPWQRKLLEEVFQCRLFTWYGHAERVVLGGECECSNFYHIFPEYGIMELLDERGNPITKEDEVGEIVGTSLDNFVMPLLRYKTMDYGVYTSKRCKCGRNYPLLKRVEGRLQELIVSRAGRLISMAAINMHSPVFDNVKQFQFYQERKGEVVFRMIKKADYTEKDTQHIEKELKKKMGEDMDLKLEFVGNISLPPSGKHRFLIQKLSL